MRISCFKMNLIYSHLSDDSKGGIMFQGSKVMLARLEIEEVVVEGETSARSISHPVYISAQMVLNRKRGKCTSARCLKRTSCLSINLRAILDRGIWFALGSQDQYSRWILSLAFPLRSFQQ